MFIKLEKNTKIRKGFKVLRKLSMYNTYGYYLHALNEKWNFVMTTKPVNIYEHDYLLIALLYFV